MANQTKHLYRDVNNKMIGGVCAGLAEYFNIDVTIIRVIAAFLAIAGWGSAIIAYIIMWIVVPERPSVINTTVASNVANPTPASAEGETMSGSEHDAHTAATDPNKEQPETGQQSAPGHVNTDFSAKNHPTPVVTTEQKHGGVYFGVFLVLVGVFALLANVIGNFSWWDLWPLFIVAAGVVQMFFPDSGKPWTPWRIVDGLITIGVGLVFLGCTVGWLSWSLFYTFFTYWPVLIIAGGLAILGSALKQHWISSIGGVVVAFVFFAAALSTYSGPGTFATSFNDAFPFVSEGTSENNITYNSDSRMSEPLGMTRDAALTLESGAGQYDVEALDSSSSDLFFVESTKRNAINTNVSGSGSSKDVNIETNNTSTAAKIKLSRDVEWDMMLKSGATDNEYDLRHIAVSNLKIETGASNTELDLGTPVNADANVAIDSGFGAIKITVPHGTPVRITSETGLSTKDFKGLTKRADGSYTNGEYEQAGSMSRIVPVWNISLKGGLAAFEFNFD